MWIGQSWQAGLAVVVGLLQAGVTVPVGTSISVRLDEPLSSQHARRGLPVSASLVAPIGLPDGRTLPVGSQIAGSVTLVQHHSLDHEARLGLTFTSVRVGQTVCPLSAQVAEVDNARERVDRRGIIEGPKNQADTIRGRVEMLTLAVLTPEFFAIDVAQTRLREGVRADIAYPAGTELRLTTTAETSLPTTCSALAPPPVDVPLDLAQLLQSAPFRATAGSPPRPGDPINVALVGTADRVSAAFERAGWTTADALSKRSDTKAVLAILEQEQYRQAPVSMAYLDGRPPELVFQKQLNTFAKRHHVRLWKWRQWQGQDVWVGAGTHDVGVKFDVAHRSFTHRVESNVDVERTKLFDDLGLAGASVAMMSRPNAPRTMTNATGDGMRSDGRVAVAFVQ